MRKNRRQKGKRRRIISEWQKLLASFNRPEMPQLHVEYPSGRSFTLRGRFRLVSVPGTFGLHPMIQAREDQPDDKAKILVIDPRATVTSQGQIIYSNPTGVMN